MIQVRLVPAAVEPVVLVKVAQLLRRAEHLVPVEAQVLVAAAQLRQQVLVEPVGLQQLAPVARAAAFDLTSIKK
jgi:hypothetical protein